MLFVSFVIIRRRTMSAVSINNDNFQNEVIDSKIPVLIDFWAPWCGPCKMISPTIDELAKEYDGKVKVCKINTDENMDLSSKYQVTSIPCLLFFKDGKPVEKIIGFKSKNDIASVINKVIG
jgi:thioredoxin 1